MTAISDYSNQGSQEIFLFCVKPVTPISYSLQNWGFTNAQFFTGAWLFTLDTANTSYQGKSLYSWLILSAWLLSSGSSKRAVSRCPFCLVLPFTVKNMVLAFTSIEGTLSNSSSSVTNKIISQVSLPNLRTGQRVTCERGFLLAMAHEFPSVYKPLTLLSNFACGERASPTLSCHLTAPC